MRVSFLLLRNQYRSQGFPINLNQLTRKIYFFPYVSLTKLISNRRAHPSVVIVTIVYQNAAGMEVNFVLTTVFSA